MTNQLAMVQELPWLWIGSRTTGLLAWISASTAVLFGLSVRTGLFGAAVKPRTATAVHRSTATLTLAFALLHIALLLPDPYANLRLIDFVVPGIGEAASLGNAMGTIAFLLLVTVVLASALRSRMSAAAWTTIHIAAYAIWPLATYHYVLVGSDIFVLWAAVLVAILTAALLTALAIRGFRNPRRARRRRPGTATAPPRSRSAAQKGREAQDSRDAQGAHKLSR